MGAGNSNNDLIANDRPTPLGVKAERTATHEFGRPVPYFAGYGRMAGTFISEPWAVRSEPVRKKVGKKKQTTGYKYFCSFAIAICLGPVDRIEEIWLDDELFWKGSISRGATDYADITVAQFGTLRLYWGTETQVEDTDLAASGVVHPAYRGQCYAVFKDWLLGQNRTNIPNIEFLLQRTPAVPWITEAQNLGDDVNPVAVLAEMLQSPRYGLGIATDRIDVDAMNAAAGILADEGLGLSPYVNGASRFSQFLGKLLDHVDGYVTQDASGLLGLRLIRTFTGSPVGLDVDTITQMPAIEATLWWDTVNEVQVKFLNRERYFESDSVSHRDRASYAIVGSTRTKLVTRDWITKQTVAWKVAAAISRQLSLPTITGTVRVKKTTAASLDVGSVVVVTYAPANLAGVVMRVTGITYDSPGTPTVSLKLREERGYLNADFYVPPPVDFGEPVKYKAEELYDEALVELPYGWTRESEFIVGLMPTRNDVVSNGFLGWWERSPGSFIDIIDSDVFWLSGSTNAAIEADTLLEPEEPILDVTFGGTDLTLDETTYNEAVSSPSQVLFIEDEILVPYDIVLVSAGRYTAKVLRARWGTLRAYHAPGVKARVVKLGDFPIAAHRHEAPTTAVQKYKLQPYFMANAFPIEDCAELTLNPRLVALAPLPPANVTVNGDGVNPTYSGGENFVVSWDETSELRDTRPPTEILTSRAQFTELEILTTADVSKGTVRVSGAQAPTTITNGVLVGFLGSETSFKLRVRYEYAGVRSLTAAEITVWKV